MSHLIDRNITYFQHLQLTLYYASISFYAGFVFIIHGLYPDILENNGSDTIKKLYTIIHFNDKNE